MTALTKDVARDGKQSKLPSFGVAANAILFRGAMLMINAAGFAVPCSGIAGSVFAGICRGPVDATGLANGACDTVVEERDSFYVAAAGIVAGDVGELVYAADDNTVQKAAGVNLVPVGKIMEVVSATRVLVQPNPNNVKA